MDSGDDWTGARSQSRAWRTTVEPGPVDWSTGGSKYGSPFRIG